MKSSNLILTTFALAALAMSSCSIAGPKASDAYFVKVDRSSMTQNSAAGKRKLRTRTPRDTASGMASGKRQHKPFAVVRPMDKSKPLHGARKIPGMHKSGDVTLKRGLVD